MELRRDAIVIYRTYVEAAQDLCEADRLSLYEAIFSYGLDGEEIELSGIPKGYFMLIKPSLTASRRKAANGQKGGKQNGSKMEANEEQIESKSEAIEEAAEKRTEKQTESKAESKSKAIKNKKQEIKDKEQEIKDKNQEIKNKGKSNTSPSSGNILTFYEKEKPVLLAFGEYKNVKMSKEQCKKLIEDFGEEQTSKYIKRVDEYCQMVGKTYSDYYLTIRQWIARDNVSEQQNAAE